MIHLQPPWLLEKPPHQKWLPLPKGSGHLSRRTAILCLVGIVIGLLALLPVLRFTELFYRVPLAMKPHALEQRARDFCKAFGYPDVAADSDFGFSYDRQVREHLKDNKDIDYLEYVHQFRLPAPYYFWYRQSKSEIVPYHARKVSSLSMDGIPQVDEFWPTPYSPDEISIRLDPEGRLTRFFAFPSEYPTAKNVSERQTTEQWQVLIEQTGWNVSGTASVGTQNGRSRTAWTRALLSRLDLRSHPKLCA